MKLYEWCAIMGVAALIAVVGIVFFENVRIQEKVPVRGELAPDFTLRDADGAQHHLSDYLGRWVILYFYPRDNTPQCTQEACAFRDVSPFLHARYAVSIVGVSVNNQHAHQQFARQYNLPFTLLADTTGAVSESYGSLWNFLVFKIARRNTFLINPEGYISNVYLHVEPLQHVQQLLNDLKFLQRE